MTNSKLITLPNPHLRQKSKKVGLVTDEIKDIIQKMQDATLKWEDSREHEVGVALAAVQIDSLIKAVVIRNKFDEKANRSFRVFINPEITKYEGTVEEDYEGCLSIKNIYGKVPRHTKVRIKALDINGVEFRLKADGFLARVFQHEIDHTNGIVFIDHIKEKTDGFFVLTEEGKLDPLDYEKDIKDNKSLWP